MPSILHMVMMQIVRSEGSSVIASLGIAIGCVTNIIIDPVFILSWGLNMGAAGAGFATFIANCVSCVYYFVVIYIKREKTYASISPKDFTLEKKIVVGVCGVGIPGGIQTLLNVVQMTILNNFTVGYGTAAMAAMGIAQKIDNVPMNIAMGGASGIMPLVSYTYASGNYSRMKEAILYFIKIMLICLFACSALFFIFSKPLIAIFMNDDSVVMYGSSFLRGFCIALPFFCMDYLTVAVFQALGKGRNAFSFAV
ncbi:MAG: polysaccharide biosynthesis C-terminal domain-containing protein, partial [Eubacterium sp.]|nr:polysaccharide biosynthesis C-terminal domain-containing protein [Eubacterium sp.]